MPSVTALESLIAFAIVAGLVFLVALLSAADASVHLLPRSRVRRLAETGGVPARALDALAERPGRLLAAEALIASGGFAAAAAVIIWALATIFPSLPLWADALLGLVVGGVLLFTLAEALPRSLALSNPERVALAAAPWTLRVTAVAYPVARVLSAPFVWAASLAHPEVPLDVPWVTEDEYRDFVSGDEEEAARDEAEDALIEAVGDFADKIVREVMVPRTDMIGLEDTATFDEALETIAKHGFSRLPVYHETLDDIVGVVFAKDLLLQLRGGDLTRVRPADIARPAYFVPETKPLEELLVEMRRTAHMAIVADEYGGTAGLVTIEDLLEEIVGDIFDEYDRQVALITELGDGRWRVDARMPVDELNERFGTAIDREAESVGGLFSELVGHIPTVGESVQIEGLRLTVTEMQGTRVRRLDVESQVSAGSSRQSSSAPAADPFEISRSAGSGRRTPPTVSGADPKGRGSETKESE
jgi:putative hemolysin